MVRNYLMLFLLLVACGPSNNDGGPVIRKGDTNNGQNNTNNRTAGTNGTNNATGGTNNGTPDPECVGIICEEGRVCVKGVCVLPDLSVACDDGESLGMVDVSQPLTLSGDTRGWADSVVTTCAEGGEFSGAENAFSFEVPAPVLVDVRLTSSAGIDWATEVRVDDCRSSDAVLICQDPERFEFLADPGKTYWIVVEPLSGIDEGAFDIELTFTELVCSPPGGRSCNGDDVVLCLAGTSEASFSCGTSCQEGTCVGDSCAAPHIVTASASFSGDTEAYSNTLNFENQPSCSMSGTQGIATPGPELVLLLPELTAGQTVTVDTTMNDDNDNGIFVLDSCSDMQGCLAAADLGDMLEFTVPADGDYYVVIDKLSPSPKTFHYTVDIQ